MAEVATGANGTPTRVPVRVTDCFLLAHDAFMRRTGQGAHVTQSVLEIQHAPDLAKLATANARLLQKFPLLIGTLRRDWRTWLPYWEVPPQAPANGLPIGLWREKGSSGALGPAAREIDAASEELQQILTRPLAQDGVNFNARLDLLELRGGHCLVALSWSHLLIDGKGAELMLAELARLCEGIDLPDDAKETVRPQLSFKEKITKTKGAINRFADFAKIGFRSLSGPRARRGRGFYQVIPLDFADSEKVRARVDKMTGSLFPLGFYLACTVRAHRRVFQARARKEPELYVASVPIQTRKRGARGPLFHNQVTVFFFGARRDTLETIESAAAAMKAQFAEMSRARLDESFTTVLELMMRLPSWLFLGVVRLQFRGEMASFYYSHTGVFAAEVIEFAGAKVTNGYHLPCLGSPPGTGIFFCERDGRINITLTWRERAITGDERRLMAAQTLEDLLGEPRPDLVDVGM